MFNSQSIYFYKFELKNYTKPSNTLLSLNKYANFYVTVTVLNSEIINITKLLLGKIETKGVGSLVSCVVSTRLCIAVNANLMELEILFEAWNFHLATNLFTKQVFNHVMRKWNLAWDWVLHPDNIALSAKPFCEVKIRKIRGQEQLFLQEQTPSF